MAGMVAKYAMKKALGKEMEKYKSKDVSGPYVSKILIALMCANSLYTPGPLLRIAARPKEAPQNEESQEGHSQLYSRE